MTVHSVFEDRLNPPSLFEGINARYYRAAEIASSFIPNEQFEHLIVRQHSLVVGPRGSGKTTLLRMLHPECLRIWKHPRANFYREKIDFASAYVATDKVWRQQIDSTSATLSTEQRHSFVERILALDVMAAMIRTLETRISGESNAFKREQLDSRAVARLVTELAGSWHLEPKFLDLGSLRIAVRNARIAARVHARLTSTSANLQALPWDEVALLAIEAFQSVTGKGDELWALLFDELEIVPASVRAHILEATRGMDPRLLVKCSLSPWLHDHTTAIDEHAGTVFNDFNVIKLFYGRRSESYSFSRKLILGRLRASGLAPRTDVPIEEAVFGASKFSGDDAKRNRTAPAYNDDSALGQVVKELAERDVDFAMWLASQGLDPTRLDSIPERRRAATVRKVRNVMIARLEFRQAGGRDIHGRLRSRKTMAMYTGGATMLDICEGNPRLLLGLLVPLLEHFDGRHPIPKQHQADALNQIADDFYALIDAIPVAPALQTVPELGDRPMRSPYREIVDRIAGFFQNAALRGRFDPQPPSTFRVPRDASDGLQMLIGRLVNMGAIVIVPDRGIKDVLIGQFDQNRLRLCYLIAAREHLPPNVDRPISIRRVLATPTDEVLSLELPGLIEDEM
jgi:energy-coupling factor transporter ATP-binding protein EcfA2